MDDQIVPSVSRTELTGIIRRLEAATSRLEDIASATLEQPSSNSQTNTSGAPTPAPTGPLPPPPVSASQPPAPKPVVEPTPPQVEAFDDFLSGPLKKYVVLSDGLGDLVAQQVRFSMQWHAGSIPNIK